MMGGQVYRQFREFAKVVLTLPVQKALLRLFRSEKGKRCLPIYTQKMCVRPQRLCFLLHRDKITQMSPIDGPIGLKMNINHPQTYSDNISKVQPSKANGLGGVR